MTILGASGIGGRGNYVLSNWDEPHGEYDEILFFCPNTDLLRDSLRVTRMGIRPCAKYTDCGFVALNAIDVRTQRRFVFES